MKFSSESPFTMLKAAKKKKNSEKIYFNSRANDYSCDEKTKIL